MHALMADDKARVQRQRLFEALLELTAIFNRSGPDDALLKLAGVSLDRALLPLLVRLDRRGPIGIGELAEICGRDHTTISRQIAKLVRMGLVARRTGDEDSRVREAFVTDEGRSVARVLDRVRDRRMTTVLALWSEEDVSDLARLLRRLADDAMALH